MISKQEHDQLMSNAGGAACGVEQAIEMSISVLFPREDKQSQARLKLIVAAMVYSSFVAKAMTTDEIYDGKLDHIKTQSDARKLVESRTREISKNLSVWTEQYVKVDPDMDRASKIYNEIP